MTLETEAQASVTGSLIALYGTSIALSRAGSWETTASGGQVRRGTLVLHSPVRRYFSHATTNDLQSATLEGDQSFVWGVLVGLADDDIQKGDTFTGPDGLKYRVRYIHHATAAWETRAEVYSYEE